MEDSNIAKDISILVIGAALGFIPWLLDKVGIEMPKPIYVGLLLLSFVMVSWALSNLGWLERISLLRGRQWRASSAVIWACTLVLSILMATMIENKSHFENKPANAEQWKEYNDQWGRQMKEIIIGQTFYAGQRILLDGYSYVNCTFDRSILIDNGTAPFDFTGNRMIGPISLISDNNAVIQTFGLAQEMDRLNNAAASSKPPSQPAVP
jgi:hypothetical protein